MMKSIDALIFVVLSALLIGIAAHAMAEPLEKESPNGHPASLVLEKKSFDRWPDPVVADCGLFASFVGKKIEFVRIYAYSESTFHPIPFQIDEKDAEKNRVYPAGEKANPQDANGLLDKGEELVFMARDCGDRVRPDAFPAGIELWEELELEDPFGEGKGWVYLLYSESNPPPISKEDYVIYRPIHSCNGEDCGIIQTKYYEDQYYPQEPYFDISKYDNIGFAHRYMSNPPEAGGTGVDYVDRLKGRLTMAFLFGMLKFHVNESSINFYEAAYKDGPVRVLRNTQLIFSLPLGLEAPGIAVEVIWYDTIVNVPMIIDIPFNPGYVLTYLELKIGEDHGPGAIGMKVYNSNNLKGCLVDGKTEGDAEVNWNNDRDEWRLMTGPQGTIMNRSFWDENYLKQMEWVTVDYIDDVNKEDPPEDEPGMLGMMLQTNRIEKIKKDRYYSYLEWYWPPNFLFTGPENTYQLGDEKTYLNIADHPIRLRLGDLIMESHYFGQMPNFEKVKIIMEEKREEMEPLNKE